jgi:hypothetical protein
MGAFNIYSKKERASLSAASRKKLQNAVMRHLKTHKGVRKIVRGKTSTLYKSLKKG